MQDILYWLGDAWDWFCDYIVEIILIAILLAIIGVGIYFIVSPLFGNDEHLGSFGCSRGCLEVGYPRANYFLGGDCYCVKMVDGTEIVRRLEECAE